MDETKKLNTYIKERRLNNGIQSQAKDNRLIPNVSDHDGENG